MGLTGIAITIGIIETIFAYWLTAFDCLQLSFVRKLMLQNGTQSQPPSFLFAEDTYLPDSEVFKHVLFDLLQLGFAVVLCAALLKENIKLCYYWLCFCLAHMLPSDFIQLLNCIVFDEPENGTEIESLVLVAYRILAANVLYSYVHNHGDREGGDALDGINNNNIEGPAPAG